MYLEHAAEALHVQTDKNSNNNTTVSHIPC